MEELDDGEGQTLVVRHGGGGSDLSVVTEGGRPCRRRGSQLQAGHMRIRSQTPPPSMSVQNVLAARAELNRTRLSY